MAKFYATVIDRTLKDNNGGSLVLWHHLHALEELGHETGLISLHQEIPEDADYIMFQSEWWGCLKDKLEKSKAKRICWLGHYKTIRKYGMPGISEIKADYFHTQYRGDCVKWGEEKIGKPIYYLPHAGCNKCNTDGKKIDCPKVLFIGNHFPERDENWLQYSGVQLVQSPFEEVKNYYKSAIVCPNIHGSFQKNEVSKFFQIPGNMINERIFQVVLSGGFAISDDTPIVKDFFTEEEVPQAKTKQEFKEMIEKFGDNPELRKTYMSKAKERILKEHLYIHRWKEYLKTL